MNDNTVIAATLQVSSDSAKESVRSFKQELRDAQNDLVKVTDKFGEMSPLVVAAAKRVAELRDKIGDAKNLADAFNPDAKFRAFSNTLQGVAGGFSAVTGVMGLLGDQSEGTQKALLKVQAALAISQGLNQIGELRDTFKQLGTFIQSTTVFQNANNLATKAAAAVQKLFRIEVETTSTSFKILKGAIAATGIGLLIVGIGEVVSALQSWSSAAEDAAEKQKELNESIKKYADIGLSGEMNYINRQEKLEIAKAQAAGKSEKEIFEIRQSWQQIRINSQKRHYDELKNVDEVASQESLNNIKTLQDDLKINRIEFEKKEAEDKKNQAKKLEDLNKQHYEKLKADTKALLDELKKLQDENYLNSISDEHQREEEKIKIDAANDRKRIEALKVIGKQGEEAKKQYLLEINKKEQQELSTLNDKYVKEDLEKRKAANDAIRQLENQHALFLITDERERQRAKVEQDYRSQIDEANTKLKNAEINEQEYTELLKQFAIQRADELKKISDQIKEQQTTLKTELDDLDKSDYQKQLDDLDRWYKDKMTIAQGNEELLTQVHDSYEKKRTAITRFELENQVSTLVSAFAQIGSLFGKNTAAYKVTALAQIAADTGKGFINGLIIAQQSAKATGPGAAFAFPIFYATQVAAVLTAAAKAKSILKGDGNGSVSTPGISTPSLSPSAPIAPTVGSTKIDADSINNIGNAAAGGVNRQPIRAYVLNGDIQSNSERDKRLERASVLGG